MKLLRTIPGFVRLLVGLFLVAQFAGVVSSPRASALTVAGAHAFQSHDSQGNAPQVHDSWGHDHHDPGDQGAPQHGQHEHANLADTCCGLHACFAGVLPQVIAIEAEGLTGKPLSVGPDDLVLGLPSGRLDRPPRPLR